MRLQWHGAGVYDEKVLVGLDFVLNEASKRGIRAVLVLANYWAMYGGIDQYNIWSFEAGSGERCHMWCLTLQVINRGSQCTCSCAAASMHAGSIAGMNTETAAWPQAIVMVTLHAVMISTAILWPSATTRTM